MNSREYIESGILELYAADLLSPEERQEVEKMLSQYPEINEELSIIQNAIAAAAPSSVAPGHIRNNIQQAIQSSVDLPPQNDKNENRTSSNQEGFLRYLYPLLLLAALAGLAYLWMDRASSQKQLSELKENTAQLQVVQDSLSAALTDCTKTVSYLSSGDLKPVYLAATEGAPTMSVKVFHDGKGAQCYIDETTVPPPPSGKQYQLWALVGDQPTDLGIIDFGNEANPLNELNCVAGATAYAITLEPLGGSVSPTLSALSAVGSI